MSTSPWKLLAILAVASVSLIVLSPLTPGWAQPLDPQPKGNEESTPTATPTPTLAAMSASALTATNYNINISGYATSDVSEAFKGNSTGFLVRVTDSSGNPARDKVVSVNSSIGEISPKTMVTNYSGYARISTPGHYNSYYPGDPFIITSDGTPGWENVTVTVDGQSVSKTIVWHGIKLKDFSQPQLIRYDPDSDDEELSNPKINFTIEDIPSISEEFELGFEIYSLDSNDSLGGNEWRVSSAGNHIVEWNELFPPGDVTPLVKGIYAFNLTIQNRGLKANVLRDHGIVNANAYSIAYDQKATPFLHIHDYKSDGYYHSRSPRVWSLSYDENSGKTRLAYTVDIWNRVGNAVDKEPQNVRIYVYDTDLNKIGEITNQTREPSFSGYAFTDGISTYYFDGEVNLGTPGDYYFVVVAQGSEKDDDNNITNNRYAGKWAIEQGSFFSSKMDVDMDVDNTTMSGYPVSANGDRSEAEEAAEATHTATIWANLGDDDADEVPNFADGINIFGNGNANACRSFEPLLMDSTVMPNGKYVFRYAASDPNSLSKGVVDGKTVYSLPDNNILRVWKKDGMASRNPKSAHQGGDYLMPGQPYSAQDLGLTSGTTRTFFVEMLEASDRENPLTITVEFYPCGIYSSAPIRKQTLRVAGYEYGTFDNPNAG